MFDMNDRVDRWQSEQDRQAQRLAICDICGEPIYEEYYHEIKGEKICDRCLGDCVVYNEVD